MGFQSNASEFAASSKHFSRFEEDSGLAADTLEDLRIARLRRVNLLVIGDPAGTRAILELLGPAAGELVTTWRPRQPLELPPPGRPVTLILQDVGQLTAAAQSAVLRWLDHSGGHTWVISTTAESLWPHVESGAFSEPLYYRLNTVCVHANTSDEQ